MRPTRHSAFPIETQPAGKVRPTWRKSGQRHCQGICFKFEKTRPYIRPYDEHALCRNCVGTGLCKDGVWQELVNLKPNGRCPCCNRLPKRKSYRNKDNYIDNHKTYQKQ